MSMVFCPGNEMTSTDIAMLRNVLATWRRETGNEADSPQAATKSAELMVWFQFGIRRPYQLLEMIRPYSDVWQPKRQLRRGSLILSD